MPDAVEREIRELRSLFWSERDPEGRAFVPLADALRRGGELDEALEVLEDGLERHRRFVPGHVVAGWVRRDRGEHEAAEHAFRMALRLDAENSEALRGLGDLAAAAGDPGEARRHYRRLAELEPADPEVARRLEGLEAHAPAPVVTVDEVVVTTEDVAASAAELVTSEPAAEADEADVRIEPEPGIEGASAPAAPGGEGLFTRTMADLYARQGLPERALRVYRHLLEGSPGDGGLRERVEAMEALVATTPEVAAVGPSAPPRARREPEVEVEQVARQWAEGAGAHGEIETPFAWTPEKPRASVREPAGRSARDYFRSLLGFAPGQAAAAVEGAAVPIESLAPDAEVAIPPTAPERVVPIASLAPDAAAAAPRPAAAPAPAPAEAPAARGEPHRVVPVEALAPTIVDVAALAPDAPEAGSGDFGRWLHRLG